ncbi:MAG: AraC family transcriptional regulator [Isosphaeraceae bacterium]|nr:AraC family transcriptional regulator [Isosphaeraceae bacterium]
MQQEEQPHGEVFDPLDRHKVIPFEAAATSDGLGWSGIQAERYILPHVGEIDAPALTHHTLVLFIRTPDELDLRYDGVDRQTPPPAGSIALMPAGSPARWRWRGRKDSLHVHLDPGLISRVAAETFELDPARLAVPPLDGLILPQVQSAMQAVDAELAAGGGGARLAAESLANVLAVHLIRHVLAPRADARARDGMLPPGRLRAVVDFVEAHLGGDPTLEQMAAVARLSPYHFARQFKAATGLPPHQYVIARRVERAKRLLHEGELCLARVAAQAGFSDQSHLSRYFRRFIGVTPGQFRRPARFD